jgi:hypothetical protein
MMDEQTVLRRLMQERWARNFCVPNYTPPGWWECDLFEVTEKRAFREYEVKLSVADFRADAKKEREVGPYVFRQPRVTERKHDRLAAADPRGPSQFYYVTPRGLLDGEPLPPWAGWIEVWEYDPENYPGVLTEKVRVKAPRIHREPIVDSPNYHMGTCYYRMHRWGREYEVAATEIL